MNFYPFSYSIQFQDLEQFTQAQKILAERGLLDDAKHPQQHDSGQGYAKQTQAGNQSYPQTDETPKFKNTKPFTPPSDKQLRCLLYHLNENGITVREFCKQQEIKNLSELSSGDCWQIINDFTNGNF